MLVDEGAFHHEEIEIPSASLDGHDRLIDCIREDPDVLKRVHVDVAQALGEQGDREERDEERFGLVRHFEHRGGQVCGGHLQTDRLETPSRWILLCEI